MERRSLLTLGAIGAAFSSGIGLLKLADHSLPHFEGVHIPESLGPADLNWLDRLNRAFAQPGGVPFQSWKRGYWLKWTGWKMGMDSTMICAQWVAYHKEARQGFYAATPGREGPYQRGDVFDISMCSGVPYLSGDDLGYPEPILLRRAAEAKIDAYKRLLKCMREHGVNV
jgi:hypothetical protein